MSSVSTSGPPSIARYAGTLITALMLISVSGVYQQTLKLTPTDAIRAEKVWEVGSSGSGTKIYADGYANLTGSGDLNFHALTLDGVVISTGSSLSETNADARYVNTSGDTMTGALIINPTTATAAGDLQIMGVASGRVLQAQDILRSSGSLIIKGAAVLQSTVSLGGVTYTFPVADGTSNQVLTTNAAGTLSWSTALTSVGQGLTANGQVVSLSAAHSGTTITATTALVSNGTLSVDGTTTLHGTTSGNTLLLGGNQVSAIKCATFDISGTGSSLLIGTGTNVTASYPAFSGSIVSVKAIYQTAGGGLTTLDVNINDVSVLSTKLTVDANELCSTPMGTCTDAAATPAVITATNTFNQYAKISVDVDGAAGNTYAAKPKVSVCTLPDADGYAPY